MLKRPGRPAPACPQCGNPVDPSWQNCAACGSELPVASPAGGPPSWLRLAVVLILVSAFSAIYPTCRAEHTRHQLSRARADLHNTKETLAAARRELASQRSSHAKLQADLDAAQSALNDAKRSADVQGSQLATIKKCINDIQSFDEASARGDQSAARSAANSADQSCAAAEALL